MKNREAPAGRTGAGYRRDIDGLRAIAVSAVVLYHAGLPLIPSGFVGVDIFFVISGYLIGGIILREVNEKRYSFLEFYARRARRILPALLAVTTCVVLFGYAFMNPVELKNLGTSADAALLAASNIKFLLGTNYFDPFAQTDPLLMTWSLGVEEQFYILFPFLVLALARLNSARRVFVLGAFVLVSFVVSLFMLHAYPMATFYLLPARAWELGIGVWLAALSLNGAETPPKRRWLVEAQGGLGLALLIVAVTAFSAGTPFPGWAAVVPTLGAALLIRARTSMVNVWLLSSRPMVFVGLISYSWYLWHWPMITYVRLASARPPTLSVLLCVAAASFLVAILSWRWIEQPFRQRKLSSPGILTRYAMVGVAALILPLAAKVGDGWPQRLPRQIDEAMAVRPSDRIECLLAPEADEPLHSEECMPGNAGEPAIAIIGDSHAAALGAGMEALASEHGLRLLRFTKSTCPPLLGVTFDMVRRPAQAESCARFMQASVREIAADPDIRIVVLAAAWWIGNPRDKNFYMETDGPILRISTRSALDEGLPQMLDALRAAGKEVVVFGDVPNLLFYPRKYLTTAAIPVRLALAHAVQGVTGISGGAVRIANISPYPSSANKWISDIVAGREGVSFVNPTRRFCTDAACRFMDRDKLLYYDNSHLSEDGSRYALADVRERLSHSTGAIFSARSWAVQSSAPQPLAPPA